ERRTWWPPGAPPTFFLPPGENSLDLVRSSPYSPPSERQGRPVEKSLDLVRRMPYSPSQIVGDGPDRSKEENDALLEDLEHGERDFLGCFRGRGRRWGPRRNGSGRGISRLRPSVRG